MRNSMMISLFLFLTISLIHKFKIVCSKWNLIQRLIWICKIQWWCLFYLFHNVLISFRRSNQMCVDVFIECVVWSYWWTWFALPIISNSKHFSFFLFYFNVSNKISSTPQWLSNFQFSLFIATPLLLGTQE